MGNFQIMLDSMNYFNVLCLPIDSIDDLITTQNVQEVLIQCQDPMHQFDIFGCNVTNYATSYKVNLAKDDIDLNDPFQVYLLAFQCTVGNVNNIFRVAQVTVYDKYKLDRKQVQVDLLYGEFQMRQRIIDLVFASNITQNFKDQIPYKLALSIELPGSYTNVLLILEAKINLAERNVEFELLQLQEAISLNKNTFIVTQILSISSSDIIVVVNQYEGAIFICLRSLTILAEIDVQKDNRFQKQNMMQLGPLQVLAIAGDMPHSIHLITNYGFFFYHYNVSLTDRSEIFPNYDKTLVPTYHRVLRYQINSFSNELSLNPYGYAFLMVEQIDFANYDVVLGAVSFYSAANNKIFRLQKIVKNQQCSQIAQELRLRSSPEDQIVVSFVCGSQLYISIICMRPRINFNLDSLDIPSTSYVTSIGERQNQVQSYNQYNVSILASNFITKGDYNNVTINLIVDYSSKQTIEELILAQYGTICILFILILILVFMIRRTTKVKSKGQSNDDILAYADINSSDLRGRFREGSSTLLRMSTNSSDTLMLANRHLNLQLFNSKVEIKDSVISPKYTLTIEDRSVRKNTDVNIKMVESSKKPVSLFRRSTMMHELSPGNQSSEEQSSSRNTETRQVRVDQNIKKKKGVRPSSLSKKLFSRSLIGQQDTRQI